MKEMIRARAAPILKAEPSPVDKVPTPEEVFERYAARVYHLACRVLGNAADAEDVTQVVFLQIVRKLPTFRGEAAFSTWLHRVTVNAALAYRRKRALREVARLPEPLEDFREDGSHRVPVRRWCNSFRHSWSKVALCNRWADSAIPCAITITKHKASELIRTTGNPAKRRFNRAKAQERSLHTSLQVESLLAQGLPEEW